MGLGASTNVGVHSMHACPELFQLVFRSPVLRPILTTPDTLSPSKTSATDLVNLDSKQELHQLASNKQEVTDNQDGEFVKLLKAFEAAYLTPHSNPAIPSLWTRDELDVAGKQMQSLHHAIVKVVEPFADGVKALNSQLDSNKNQPVTPELLTRLIQLQSAGGNLKQFLTAVSNLPSCVGVPSPLTDPKPVSLAGRDTFLVEVHINARQRLVYRCQAPYANGQLYYHSVLDAVRRTAKTDMEIVLEDGAYSDCFVNLRLHASQTCLVRDDVRVTVNDKPQELDFYSLIDLSKRLYDTGIEPRLTLDLKHTDYGSPLLDALIDPDALIHPDPVSVKQHLWRCRRVTENEYSRKWSQGKYFSYGAVHVAAAVGDLETLSVLLTDSPQVLHEADDVALGKPKIRDESILNTLTGLNNSDDRKYALCCATDRVTAKWIRDHGGRPCVSIPPVMANAPTGSAPLSPPADKPEATSTGIIETVALDGKTESSHTTLDKTADDPFCPHHRPSITDPTSHNGSTLVTAATTTDKKSS